MRVLIVAPNISMRMGGEAVLPAHCIRELRAEGVEVSALTHARVRDELKTSDLWKDGGFHFVEDAASERALYRLGKRVPAALRDAVFEPAITTITLARLAARARDLARETGADIIHQPTPVSPRLPSFLTNMPAPVIIGPLNGDMSDPPAFRREFSRGSGLAIGFARAISGAANAAFPGKRAAARVLVANPRTGLALPAGIGAARVERLVENGVDLSLWTAPAGPRAVPPTFVFVGRLVWWKGAELLLEAFSGLGREARLLIIGDGEERPRLERFARDRCGGRSIEFLGFRPQAEIRDILGRATALVLPSMRECGGAVILEAFACKTPAIATDWGGPQDYITPQTGFLVAPDGRAGFVRGLTEAMARLCEEPDLARRMGEAARRRVEERFSWRAKAATLIDLYERVLAER
jgi:glycosyltransferase involved in cell wall biosynthesis